MTCRPLDTCHVLIGAKSIQAMSDGNIVQFWNFWNANGCRTLKVMRNQFGVDGWTLDSVWLSAFALNISCSHRRWPHYAKRHTPHPQYRRCSKRGTLNKMFFLRTWHVLWATVAWMDLGVCCVLCVRAQTVVCFAFCFVPTRGRTGKISCIFYMNLCNNLRGTATTNLLT